MVNIYSQLEEKLAAEVRYSCTFDWSWQFVCFVPMYWKKIEEVDNDEETGKMFISYLSITDFVMHNLQTIKGHDYALTRISTFKLELY